MDHSDGLEDRPATTDGRRIVLATFGSLGDVHPYVALGAELKRRGHRPVIATSEHWRAKVEAEGLVFAPLRPDAPPPEKINEFMADLFHPTRGPMEVIGLFMGRLRETYDDLEAAAEGADLIVGHPLTFPARLVSEKTGIPWASSVLAPLSLLSEHEMPVLPAAPGLARLEWIGPRFNRLLIGLMKRRVARWSRPWHRLRSELGLPTTSDEPIVDGQHAPGLVLALFSEQLGARQPDWPPNTVVAGFCIHDRDAAEDATPEVLDAFLGAGTPPIVFTLGSSAVWTAGRFFEESLDAATRLGRRAVLLVGPEGASALPDRLPDVVAAFRYAPFSTLFPRAAAIVHQGGVGTTAQAMRAGRPMLVVPFAFDQFDNAARVARRGIARVLPIGRYSGRRAAAALRVLLDDRAVADRAAEVGRIVREENGPATAADAIEAYLAGAVGRDGNGRVAGSWMT